MTAKKISDSDKQEIINLYRHTGETTSTLAERYDVSNSTISRLLKSTLAEEEYEALIATKRAARTFHTDARQTSLFSEPKPYVTVAEPLVELEPSPEDAAATLLAGRYSAASKPEEAPRGVDFGAGLTSMSVGIGDESLNPPVQLKDTPSDIVSSASQLNEEKLSNQANQPKLKHPQPLKIAAPIPRTINEDALSNQGNQPERLDSPAAFVGTPHSPLDEDSDAQATAVAQMLGEDLLDESEELTDLDDEDDDEDLEDLDEDDLDEEVFSVRRPMRSATLVQVLPLSEATLPKTCYLVIDRASELITRPLRDFGDLGQIPSQEFQQKTLPVFDNHRVARRFSTKRDRVIKVPDSRLLQKTRSQLQAKGITRLLVDGQVYSLSK